MQFSIDTSGLDRIAAAFEDISDRATDLSPIGQDFAAIMREDVRKRFASAPATQVGGQVYGGLQWDRLTDATFAMSPARRGGRIGTVSGQLRLQSTVESSGNIYQVDGTNFAFELISTRAQNFSQYRQLVGWHPELLRQVAQKVADYFGEALNG